MRRQDQAAPRGTWTLFCLVLAPLALSGCDDTPVAAPVAVAVPPSAAPSPASGPGATAPQPQPQPQPHAAEATIATTDQDQAGSQPASAPVLLNDPSAPSGTPLCGMAARESNALGQALLSRQYAQAGQCATYACYDAATATYIGADGYRHVCR
jgi:hypothetical protein